MTTQKFLVKDPVVEQSLSGVCRRFEETRSHFATHSCCDKSTRVAGTTFASRHESLFKNYYDPNPFAFFEENDQVFYNPLTELSALAGRVA